MSHPLSIKAGQVQGRSRNLFRIAAVDDPNPRLVGAYHSRTDAAKALAEIAYLPERAR